MTHIKIYFLSTFISLHQQQWTLAFLGLKLLNHNLEFFEYNKYHNLIVLVVPSNQFANQEPKSEREILQFCSDKYNVSFRMTSKIKVKGKLKHPVYAWLTEKENNQVDDFKISWNFNKFLIDPEGNLIEHFTSKIKPLSENITSLIK